MILMLVFLLALFPQLELHVAAADKVTLNTTSTTFMRLGDTLYTPESNFPYLVSFELLGPSGDLVESQSYRTSGSYWYSMGGLSPGYNGANHYLFTARTTGAHTLRITTGTISITKYDQRNGIVYWEVTQTNTKAYTVEITDPCEGNHAWGEWTQIKAPTCTQTGQKMRTCTRCNVTEYDTIPAAHSWSEWTTTVLPTCTEKGVETCYCSRCDATETRDVDALGHDLVHHDGKAATCTEKGWDAYDTCSRCDYTTYKEISETGHNYTKAVTAPTCTEKGYTTYTCSCGDSYVADYKDALGHDYKDGVCDVCGAKDPDYEPPVKENPFADVSESSVYYDAILWAYYHEPQQITGGYTATEFRPGNPCTRGQVVTFLWRAAGCPEPTGDINVFKDAYSIAAPYQKAVAWAVEKGITTGFTDGTFRPNDSVTRAQFVTFLWRYENKPATSGSIAGFTDAASISGPYQQAVAWAVEKGITTGYNDGSFRPNATCTRWAVVLFMYRDMK